MRKFIVFFVAFAMTVCLLASCGGSDDDDDMGLDDVEDLLSSMSPGDWAEHETSEGNRYTWKFIGEDTWEGVTCFVMEFEQTYDGGESVSQIWINKSSGVAVLAVIEMGGEPMRMDPSAMGDMPNDDTWEEDDNTEKIGTDSYTTPTGKTVSVTIYRTQASFGVSDEWVSAEVPFMMVKELGDGGQITVSLYDFGGGATRSISKTDAENAKEFGMPTFPPIDDPADPNDDPLDPGDVGQEGDIVITVGDGPRPRITVSKPVINFSILGGNVIWGFIEGGQNVGLPGPFDYGVVPDNAQAIGVANPPDLEPGVTYTISVIGELNGFVMPMGTLVFVHGLSKRKMR